jgi:hypothetical protein
VKVLITGGYFDASGECFIDEVDLARGVSRRMLSFFPAPNVRVPAKGFTGGCWLDSTTLLVCSFNAVHRIDTNNWRETGRLEQADFNDLHHVSHDAGTGHIFVCNTGLDSVEVFDSTGRFVARHATSPAWFEKERLEGQAVDRARYPELLSAGWSGAGGDVPRTHPRDAYYGTCAGTAFGISIVRDYLHPNHAVAVDGCLAVTMLAPREVRCLGTHQVLARTDGHPHDGQVEGCRFWTTTTRGVVTAWDRTAGVPWRASETHDVFESGYSGWCRGLHVAPDRIVVGLTEMRSPPQFAWCDRSLSATSTAVVALERGTGRLLQHTRLGEPERHPKIFSILPAPR